MIALAIIFCSFFLEYGQGVESKSEVVTVDLFEVVKGQQQGIPMELIYNISDHSHKWGLGGQLYTQLGDKHRTSGYRLFMHFFTNITDTKVHMFYSLILDARWKKK
jgi:hypothetical protein